VPEPSSTRFTPDRREFVKLAVGGALGATAFLSSSPTGSAALQDNATGQTTASLSTVVWQIGKFDGSSYEFHLGVPAEDPVFVVGKSDPAKEWYRSQSGTSNGTTGFRAHPFTVKFELPQAPQGLYTFRFSLLVYGSRLPILKVDINGHIGQFFQHPVLDYSATEWPGHFVPQMSKASIRFDVPTACLQQGTNTLVLTAVDEPNKRDDSQTTEFTLGNSAIVYDALALEHDPSRTYASKEVFAEVLPTIFYKGEGRSLVELVDVFVRYNEPPHGRVTLALGANHLTQELAEGTEFGEQKLRFEVPEFGAPTDAQVMVSLNGRSRRFSVLAKPAKKWNVFLVPHEHLDIGYTDYVPKVAEVQSRSIDDAIDMIHEQPDFRYTIDGYWPVEQFMAGRSDAQRREFLQLVREKKIFVPADYANPYTGVASLEYLLRSFYPSYKFNRENGGNFNLSLVTDVPSQSWSYPSIMASAGLKYLMLPSNSDLGPILLYGRQNEKSPFWWEGPDGQRVLTWYSRMYYQIRSLFSLPPKVESGHDTLPIFLQAYARPDYKSDGVIVFGSQVENTVLFRDQTSLANDWNKVYAYPKLKFSGVAEAMEYIGGQIGDSIPVIRGDGVGYWDGSEDTLIREDEQRVLTTEKVSTIMALVNPRLRPDGPAMDQLWNRLLRLEEHTSSGGRSGTLRAAHTKAQMTLESQRLMEHVLARAMSALGDSIQDPSGTVIVFNSLNWQRSKLVELTVGWGMELVDRVTSQVVPVEELSSFKIGDNNTDRWGAQLRVGPDGKIPGRPEGGPGTTLRRIRFLATDVPAIGYKCYALREGKSSAPERAAVTGQKTLENAYYRVLLDLPSGAIASIFDKELNREMVDSSSPYRFNQYVLATGTQDVFNRRGVSTEIIPPPNLETHLSQGGRLISVSKNAFGTVAQLESSATGAQKITTTIILFDGQKRLEIANQVHREHVNGDSWAYFAFPVAMNRPEFRYEIQNGVVNPAKDTLPGAGMEKFPVQHWVAIDQDDVTAAIVPIDAPLVAFGDIIRWVWPKEFGTRKAAIFSYLSGRSGGTDGLTSRYVFTSGRKLSPGVLSKLGWDAMSPFELDEIIEQDKIGNPTRPLDPAQGSFVQVDHPAVVLVTWKQAEDEKGTIMRFVETDGRPGTVNVSSTIVNVEKGWLCNSVEENQEPLTISPHGFSFSVKSFGIVTVRLEGTPRLEQTLSPDRRN
jgi:alpha-mannosidase